MKKLLDFYCEKMYTATITLITMIYSRKPIYTPKTRFTIVFKKHVFAEDHAHVQSVWQKFDMKTLEDLHDHYMLTDVL